MSVSVEKSGSKVKIPPDDWTRPPSESRSKRSRQERKRSSKSSTSKGRDGKSSSFGDKNRDSKPKRELSAKEKNRKRVEEQRAMRERKHLSENVKRTGSLNRQSDQKHEKPVSGQIRRVASFGDPPRRRKRLKTRGERSRRAASVESSRQSGRSNGKSCHDSGIALMEESCHENSPNSPNISQLHIQEESDQCNWDSGDGEPNRPIVAFNSDPDVTIRFREQYRNLQKPSKLTEKSDSKSKEHHHKSDGDLFNPLRPLEIACIDFNTFPGSDAERLDDAKKLHFTEAGKTAGNSAVDDKAALAQIDDWINQVEQKQAVLSSQKTKVENKSDTGWSSEADLMRPGSGLEQLSHFADRLVNSKCNIARHKSFAAIPSKPELETHHEKSESVGEEECVEIRAPSVSIPNLGALPELSESFRNKLQSWEDLGAIRAQNLDLGSKSTRRRGTSSASNVLHRMSLPVGNWLSKDKSERKAPPPAEGKYADSSPQTVSPQNVTPKLRSPSENNLSQQQVEEETRELAQQRKQRRSKCCFFTICS
jgi:hypothetical protein